VESNRVPLKQWQAQAILRIGIDNGTADAGLVVCLVIRDFYPESCKKRRLRITNRTERMR